MSEATPRSVLKHVGGWTLGATLGRGGFGHVRKATHFTGQTAACKILPSIDESVAITKDSLLDALEAQKEEILLKIMNGLRIEGVVGIDMVKEEKQWRYLFLPMLPKSASSDFRLPAHPQHVIPFMRQVLSTLHALHAIGIWHEDLKPANILLDGVGRPFLADYGLARFSPRRDNPLGKGCAGGGGTYEYMSPEKITGYSYDGAAADVFAMGIILHLLLTNVNPFMKHKKESERVIEDRITENRATFHLGEERGGAGELVRLMLRPKPEERPTIPQILQHPFLCPPRNTQFPNRLPIIHLPRFNETPIYTPDPETLREITFLSYLAGEWYPIETDRTIRRHLRDEKGSRWEKRMYHALKAWKPRDPDAELMEARGNKPMLKALSRLMSDMSIDVPLSPTKQAKPAPHNLSPQRQQPLSPRAMAFPPVKPLKIKKIGAEQTQQNQEKINKENINDVFPAIVAPVAGPATVPKVVVDAGDEKNKSDWDGKAGGAKDGVQEKQVAAKKGRVEAAKTEAVKALAVQELKQDPPTILITDSLPKEDKLSSTEESEAAVPPVRKAAKTAKNATKPATRKKANTRVKKASKDSFVLDDEEGEDDPDDEYLPAPLPKTRAPPRRSPRLQGAAPEHEGLLREPRVRRGGLLAA